MLARITRKNEYNANAQNSKTFKEMSVCREAVDLLAVKLDVELDYHLSLNLRYCLVLPAECRRLLSPAELPFATAGLGGPCGPFGGFCCQSRWWGAMQVCGIPVSLRLSLQSLYVTTYTG